MVTKLKSHTTTAFVNTGFSLLILRVFAAGMLFYGHGYGKAAKVLTGNLQFADPIGIGPELSLILAVFVECICTIFVIIGFYTRLASLILIFHFAIILLFVHSGQAFGHLELPLLYLLLFTVIFLLGPGKLSLDSKL